MHPFIQYLVFCILAGIFLWVISKFPALDGTVVQFMRITVIVALAILFLNWLLLTLFQRTLGSYLVG